MRRQVTFFLASPILLPSQGPATPDSWLAWAQMALTRPDFRAVRPQALDWVPRVDLPLSRDARADVWAVSSLIFPDPGVWVPNTGYRKDPNSGDIQGRAAAFSSPVMVGSRRVESLYKQEEASNTIFRAMIYDLSGWYTPRITFLVEYTPDQADRLERLLALLAAVGVGRKTADGYGAVRDWTWEGTDENPVWTPTGLPRRPIPASCVPDSLETARYVYALQEARWHGVPTLCAGPGPDTWHPTTWRPEPLTSSKGDDSRSGNQTENAMDRDAVSRSCDAVPARC